MTSPEPRYNYTSTVKTIMSCLGNITIARTFWGQISGEINLDNETTRTQSPKPHQSPDTINDAAYTSMWESLGPIEQAMVAKDLVDHYGPNLKAILTLILSPKWDFKTAQLPSLNVDVTKNEGPSPHPNPANTVSDPDFASADEFIESKEFLELEKARIELDFKRNQSRKATQNALKNGQNGPKVDQESTQECQTQCQSSLDTTPLDNGDNDGDGYCGPCDGEEDDEEEDEFWWSPENINCGENEHGGEYWDNDIVGVHQAGLFWDESSDGEGGEDFMTSNSGIGGEDKEKQSGVENDYVNEKKHPSQPRIKINDKPPSQSPVKPSEFTLEHSPQQQIQNDDGDEEDDEDAMALKRYLAKKDSGLGIDDDDF